MLPLRFSAYICVILKRKIFSYASESNSEISLKQDHELHLLLWGKQQNSSFEIVSYYG